MGFQSAIQSLPGIMAANDEFDTLSLRNRDVTETLSPLDDLGQEQEEFDKLELRSRTVTETLSPLDDLGQDAEVKSVSSKENFDKLELRNRTVTETLSPLSDLGQDAENTNGTKEKMSSSNGEFDKLELRNRTIKYIYFRSTIRNNTFENLFKKKIINKLLIAAKPCHLCPIKLLTILYALQRLWG